MPKPYSDDLRERVIEAVEAGASRRCASISALGASMSAFVLQMEGALLGVASDFGGKLP
jgi:hypothetical protein